MNAKIKLLVVGLCMIFTTCLNAQNTEFWGITPGGGFDDVGTIFSLNGDGTNQQVKHSFDRDIKGYDPQGGLLKANNGKFYGLTSSGGNLLVGIIYEFDPIKDTVIKKQDFRGITNGAYPIGNLVQASNGKLYGMTFRGGINDAGVLFEYDYSLNTLIKKWDFDTLSSGQSPIGGLVEASNGKLYGLTEVGGLNNLGVLFEYDIIKDTLIKKADFNGSSNGKTPTGSLVIGDSNKLYGMTIRGGINNLGVLFEYDISLDTLIKKKDFKGTNGSYPSKSLTKVSNGNFYGVTWAGGTNNEGVLFEYNPILNTLIKIQDFVCSYKGCNPSGPLVQDSAGNLYGVTANGGFYSDGALYIFNPTNGFFAKKQNFQCDSIGCYPITALVKANNDLFYGITTRGGLYNRGALYDYKISSNTLSKKNDFIGTTSGTEDGNFPIGSLIQAGNGKLYGAASSGGEYGQGVFFEFNQKKNLFTTKKDFKNDSSGFKPEGTFMEASNGKIYGLSPTGGINNDGMLFEYDYNLDTFLIKHHFKDSSTGKYPSGKIIEASNGKLYGVARLGATQNLGAIFEYDIIKDTLIKKQEFTAINNSRNAGPSPLIEYSNGKLYGLAKFGGSNNVGLIYEYDPILDTIIIKYHFSQSNDGSYPNKILATTNGKIYGSCLNGGTNGYGVLFEYNPTTNVYDKKQDFDEVIRGNQILGELMEASTGKIYGMTRLGGNKNVGVIFEYDPQIDSLKKILDFNSSNGSSPTGSLIEIIACPIQKDTLSIEVCKKYITPSGVDTITSIGFHIIQDTLQNKCGADSILIINLTITSIDTSITKNGDSLFANQSGASYKWLNCDSNYVIISGAIDQLFSPTKNGFYVCEITLNGCVDTSACVQVIHTGIVEELLQSNIKIYPNPVGDFLSIEMEQYIQNTSISVRNVSWQIVYTNSNLHSGKIQIDASNWAKGIYFVRIISDNFDQVVKIVRN